MSMSSSPAAQADTSTMAMDDYPVSFWLQDKSNYLLNQVYLISLASKSRFREGKGYWFKFCEQPLCLWGNSRLH